MSELSDVNQSGEPLIDQSVPPVVKAYIDGQLQNCLQAVEQVRKKKWKNAWRSASPITKGSFLLTGASAFATIAYAIIAAFQLSEMKHTNKMTKEALLESNNALERTLDKMQKQVDAANGQNTLLKQQLEGTMAAVIKVSAGFLIEPNRHEVQISLMNTGHTIATNVHVDGRVDTRELPGGKLVAIAVPISYTIAELGLTQDLNQMRSFPLRLSDESLRLIADTKESLRLEGVITFQDGFETRRVPLCLVYLTYVIRDASGKAIQSATSPSLPSSPQFPCDEYDATIKQILEQKKAALSR